MMEEPEDDRLDQSLRDTFSDFDLPPSGHVWSGIEGHLSAMPGPPRTVPLLLLLPAVGLVGVAVGWLLPHPTEPPAQPRPAITAQAAIQPSRQPVQEPVAYSAPQAPLSSNTVRLTPAARTNSVTKRVPAAAALPANSNASAAVAYQPLDSIAPVADLQLPTSQEVAPSTKLDTPESAADQPLLSSPTEVSSSTVPSVDATSLRLRDTAGAVHSKYATEPSKQSFKNESLREWRPEYRTPKHRLEERGGRLRRIRNSITKHWQNLFAPHRSGQPAS